MDNPMMNQTLTEAQFLAIKEAILEGDCKNDYNSARVLMLREGEKLGLSAINQS